VYNSTVQQLTHIHNSSRSKQAHGNKQQRTSSRHAETTTRDTTLSPRLCLPLNSPISNHLSTSLRSNSLLDVACSVCETGSMQRSCVRPSVGLSVPSRRSKAAAAGLLLSAGPAGAAYQLSTASARAQRRMRVALC